MKKSILKFFIVFCLFSFNIRCVDAAVFERGRWNAASASYIPKYMDGNVAYCASHYYYAPPTGSIFYINSSWATSNVCGYKDVSSGVDCSVMVGYIISAGRDLATSNGFGNITSASNYLLVQKAINSYLYLYSNGYWSGGNDNFLNLNYGGVPVYAAIVEAWNRYQAYLSALNGVNINLAPANNMSVSLSVDGGDNKLYYNPNKQAYYSYKITANVSNVPNINNLTTQLSLANEDLEVRFCTDDSEGDGYNKSWDKCYKTLLIPKNKQVSFYLITKTPLSGEIKINASAIYSVTSQSSVAYRDSVMYNYNHRYYNGHDPQKIVILDPAYTSSSKTITKKVIKSTSLKFTVAGVKLGSCSNLYSGYDTDKNVSKNVICENNKDRGESGSTSASFTSCNPRTIKLSYYYRDSNGVCKTADNASTSIVIGQKGYFNFGKISGDTSPIIKGQGFYLNNVYYINQVSWKNALTYSNGSVYYWLPNNGSVHHNTYVYKDSSCSGEAVLFDNYAKSYTATYDVTTGSDYASNMKHSTFKTYTNTLDMGYVPSNITKDGNVSQKISSGNSAMAKYIFNAPNAYLKIKDSNVFYNVDGESDNDFSGDSSYISGGQRYYTIMKYVGSTFPFNVDVTNLSSISEITWKLNGECDIDLEHENCDEKNCGLYLCEEKNGVTSCKNNYTYRTISVNNPFPKAVASNWVGYYNSSSGMTRLKSTFDNGIYYSISLKSNDVEKITNYNESDTYTTFNNLNENGVSSVVSSTNGFTTIANGESYCKLGEFSASCDKLK